jgi:hypothetical protein
VICYYSDASKSGFGSAFYIGVYLLKLAFSFAERVREAKEGFVRKE